METLEFFDTVLPHTGLRCIGTPVRDPAAPGGKGFKNIFCPSNGQATTLAHKIDQDRKANAYMALASFRVAGTRKGSNAIAVRSFWLDVDCGDGKPYATARAAAAAVLAFARTLGLPTPFLVSSGRGLHVYWPLTEDIDPDAWRATAQALKAACVRLGLRADPSRTADISSVLRPVGTHHRKGEPKPVRMLMVGMTAPHEDICDKLLSYGGSDDLDAPDLFAPTKPAHLAAMSAGINNDMAAGMEYPPTVADRVADACAIIDMVRRGKTPDGHMVDQPTWYQSLGVIARCINGLEVAHEWSALDPRYTYAETQGALDRVQTYGPATCAKLGEQHPDACEACPIRGRVKSPIMAGVDLAPLQAASERTAATSEYSDLFPLDLERFRRSNRQGLKLSKRQFLLGAIAHRGEILVLSNPGGGGKTTVAVGMAYSLAWGIDLLGFDVPAPGTALFLSLEEPQSELDLKCAAAEQYYLRHVPAPADAASRAIFVGSEFNNDINFSNINYITRREEIYEIGFRALEQKIEAVSADIVIVDSLSIAVNSGMNDNAFMYSIVRRLKVAAKKCNCAIVLLAHTNKKAIAGAETAEGVMGASAIVNGARNVVSLYRLPDQVAAQLGADFGASIFQIVDQKSNYSPKSSGSYIEIIGEYVKNAQPPIYPKDDCIAVATKFTPVTGGRQVSNAVLKAAMVAIATGVAGSGLPLTMSKNSPDRYYLASVAKAVAPHLTDVDPSKLVPASEAAARAAIQHAADHAWTEEVEVVIARSKRRALRLRWGATPWASEPPPGGPHVV